MPGLLLIHVTANGCSIQVEVFWCVTPCSDVGGYQRFGGPYYLLLQGEVIGVWTQIQVVVFWVVTPCSDAIGYKCFG